MAIIEPALMQEKTECKETFLFESPSFSDPKSLELLFRQHYTELCRYSLRFVKQAEIAEEIVQDIFVKLWQKQEPLLIQSSVRAYLYASVRNASLNYLKSQFARQKFESDSPLQASMFTDNTQETLDYQELSRLVQAAVEKLPAQCRVIFEMSRFGGFSHKEIAEELKISPKTVENQMGIGLKKIKELLLPHWELLLILLIIKANTNGYF